ncbi:MAG: hypothetical protein KTU85_05115 [Acidimicrobiia bacterium]|nr:hypothetical protein [Acidimicrobiia bacterium]MCY4456721.1 hypothetical protein [Acidimicrobiaceae bacterium]
MITTTRPQTNDRTTIAALLVLLSATMFVVIALVNRHDHATHVHPSDTAVASNAVAVDPTHDHSSHDHSDILANSFVSTERLSPPVACRTIIGCDDPGPQPQSPGDRGGWAQLMTLSLLATAIGFIAWKVAAAVRGARPENLT